MSTPRSASTMTNSILRTKHIWRFLTARTRSTASERMSFCTATSIGVGASRGEERRRAPGAKSAAGVSNFVGNLGGVSPLVQAIYLATWQSPRRIYFAGGEDAAAWGSGRLFKFEGVWPYPLRG